MTWRLALCYIDQQSWTILNTEKYQCYSSVSSVSIPIILCTCILALDTSWCIWNSVYWSRSFKWTIRRAWTSRLPTIDSLHIAGTLMKYQRVSRGTFESILSSQYLPRLCGRFKLLRAWGVDHPVLAPKWGRSFRRADAPKSVSTSFSDWSDRVVLAVLFVKDRSPITVLNGCRCGWRLCLIGCGCFHPEGACCPIPAFTVRLTMGVLWIYSEIPVLDIWKTYKADALHWPPCHQERLLHP